MRVVYPTRDARPCQGLGIIPLNWTASKEYLTDRGDAPPAVEALRPSTKRATISKPPWPESTSSISETPGTIQRYECHFLSR